jgi:predicted DCC family thiol-disulfide oxidoreductase YuxK
VLLAKLALVVVAAPNPALIALYAAGIAVIVLGGWPKTPVTVLWDGTCGFCAQAKKWLCIFDCDNMLDWIPHQSGAGEALGITPDQASRRLHIASDGRIWSGFGAFKQMVLWNPVWHLTAAILLALPGPSQLQRNIAVALLLFLFSPLFAPVGEAAYDLVARNRHRFGNSTCALPNATEPPK